MTESRTRRVLSAFVARDHDSLTQVHALWYRGQIFGTYDQDTDGRVTKQEFQRGYTDMGRCCGGSCPQHGWCGVLDDEMFPTVDTEGTLLRTHNTLTGAAFLERLEEFQDTTLVPGCHRVADVNGTGGRAVTLWSETGEIRLAKDLVAGVDRAAAANATRLPARAAMRFGTIASSRSPWPSRPSPPAPNE